MPRQSDESKPNDPQSTPKPKQRQPRNQSGLTAAKLRSLNLDDLATIRTQQEQFSALAKMIDANAVVATPDYSSIIRATQNMLRQAQPTLASINAANSLATSLDNVWRGYDMTATVSKILGSLKLPETALGNALASFAENLKAVSAVPDLKFASTVLAVNLGSISKTLESLNLVQTHPFLSATLLQPQAHWTVFVRDTQERLDSSKSEHERNALTGSLALAEDELLESTADMEAVLQVPEDDDVEGPTYSMNVLEIQRDELLARNPPRMHTSLSVLRAASLTAGISEQARRVEDLIVRCNESAKLQGADEIFKPTTQLLRAYTYLPWIAAKDDSTLGNVVDCLYWMLYEAAGSNSLRFLAPGLLTKDDCAVIWYIKDLRNKRLRHDPDHGSDSEQRAKWKDLRSTLVALGLSTWPHTPEQYRLLQMQLIGKAIAFLERLATILSSQIV